MSRASDRRQFASDMYESFDSFDEEEDEQRDREEPQCKYCGSTDVRWRLQTGKWTLFDMQPGKLHLCRGRPSADDFDVIEEKP
jgi:hypothetical protein